MQFSTVLGFMKKEVEVMSKESAIQSEQEFVGIFLEESVGLYAKNKNSEHMGTATNEQFREWLKDDLVDLLDGLVTDAGSLKNVGKLVDTLKANLDVYINSMDDELTHARNQVLIKEGTRDPDSIKLDEALLKAAAKSDLIKVSKALKGQGVEIQDTGYRMENSC